MSALRLPMMRDGVPVVVGDHTARDFRAIGVEHAHGVAALEAAADRGHAGGQQALARAQRLQGARIDRDCTARAQRPGDPLLARILRIGRGQEPAAVGALFEAAHRVQRGAPAVMAMAQPAAVAIFAAAILVAMPPEPTADAEPPPMASISGVMSRTSGMSRAVGIEVRIGGIQPGHIGQQQQAVRARHLRDTSRETVVVAIADLGSRDRVVFVDDRQRAELAVARRAWRGH